MSNLIKIVIYKWAGQFGPFKIRIPCGECSLTTDIVNDTLAKELADIPVTIESHNWLDNWYKPFLHGGWHAPIVLVDNKVISQGEALNRGVLIQAVIQAYAQQQPISNNHLFGKQNCNYCTQAKQLLADNNIDYVYHDVIKEPKALYEMIARTKAQIGEKTPVTTPQIWLDGKYIGGFEQLSRFFSKSR